MVCNVERNYYKLYPPTSGVKPYFVIDISEYLCIATDAEKFELLYKHQDGTYTRYDTICGKDWIVQDNIPSKKEVKKIVSKYINNVICGSIKT